MKQPTYDSVILAGDRVALAPHLDLWMAGVRFGTVESTATRMVDGQIRNLFRVRANGRTYTFASDDILGAIR